MKQDKKAPTINSYSVDEQFSITYAHDIAEIYKKHEISCCAEYADCSIRRRCTSPFASNYEHENKCETFKNLCKGNIYLGKSKQDGFDMNTPIKSIETKTKHGVSLKFHLGRNRHNEKVYVCYFWFNGGWNLLTSDLLGNLTNSKQLTQHIEQLLDEEKF